MTATLGLLSLLLLGGPAAGAVPQQPRAVVGTLYLDNGIDRGDWGYVQMCADGSYVFAFDIKYAEPGVLDDTCVNAIRLFCEDVDNELTGAIMGSEGSFGQWKGMRMCPGGEFMEAMRANVLPDKGPHVDDVGMDNLQMQCSGGTILDGLYGTPSKGQGPPVVREMRRLGEREVEAVHVQLRQSAQTRDYGEWGSWVSCSTGNKICGLQVRLEDDHPLDDDAGISDAIMYCCN